MRAFKLNGLSLGLLLLTACGSHSNEDPRGQAPENRAIVGPLADALKAIQTSEYASDCDRKLDATKTKLLRFAIQRTDLEVSHSSSTATNSQYVKFSGKYLFNGPTPTPHSEDWIHDRYSWSSVDKIYEANKDHLTSSLWNYVNSMVRSLLLEDQRRVIYGVNDGIDHENVALLGEIKQAVDLCQADLTCTHPTLSASTLIAADAIPFYHYYLSEIAHSSDAAVQRGYVERFKRRVDSDSEIHLPHWNPELKFDREDAKIHLQLSLDATKFSDVDQALVKSNIESVWKTDSIDLQVLIKSKSMNANFFELLFHPLDPGERDFVSRNDKTLNLFPLSRTRSIAHEFGHVIGLSDHYYAVWDATNCEYDQQSSDLDLMSNSSTGNVTPEEWRSITDHLQVQ
jgi:hypothetical protein